MFPINGTFVFPRWQRFVGAFAEEDHVSGWQRGHGRRALSDLTRLRQPRVRKVESVQSSLLRGWSVQRRLAISDLQLRLRARYQRRRLSPLERSMPSHCKKLSVDPQIFRGEFSIVWRNRGSVYVCIRKSTEWWSAGPHCSVGAGLHYSVYLWIYGYFLQCTYQLSRLSANLEILSFHACTRIAMINFIPEDCVQLSCVKLTFRKPVSFVVSCAFTTSHFCTVAEQPQYLAPSPCVPCVKFQLSYRSSAENRKIREKTEVTTD